jgi:hypothetical protein
MKRIKKNTPLSMVLMSLGAFSLPLMFVTGNLLLGILSVVLIIGGFMARKTESYDEYRNRYEAKYGMSDEAEEEQK